MARRMKKTKRGHRISRHRSSAKDRHLSLRVKVPGGGQFIANTKGLLSDAVVSEASRRIQKEFPGSYVWANLD